MAFIFDANPRCLIAALRTITPDHRCFQKISIDMIRLYSLWDLDFVDSPMNLRDEATRTVWLEFDFLVVQLWESHGSRVDAQCNSLSTLDREKVGICVEFLLPEATKKGIVDITESGDEPVIILPWNL